MAYLERLLRNESFRKNFFIVICAWFFWNLGMDNLRHWMLIQEKVFHSDFLWTLVNISGYGLIAFIPLAPVALGIYKRSWRLSERWLFMFGLSLLAVLSDFYGFQNPYMDHTYIETPWLDFIERWEENFLMMAIFWGPGIALIHFWAHTPPEKTRPLWWRISSIVFAYGITIAAFVALFQLWHT